MAIGIRSASSFMTRPDRLTQRALFDAAVEAPDRRADMELAPGAVVLRAFAIDEAPALLAAIEGLAQAAPWRHMTTARGWRMSVAMTNCGEAGWLSDRTGYRYDAIDPQSKLLWPALPGVFVDLAMRAARAAGYEHFVPDACLVNRYEPGARLSLHQDRNERDFGQPIVSVSLGVPATFLWGGRTRADRPRKVRLEHGDVVVWGGASRLNFHGIEPVREDAYALTGNLRFNLTFRRAR